MVVTSFLLCPVVEAGKTVEGEAKQGLVGVSRDWGQNARGGVRWAGPSRC